MRALSWMTSLWPGLAPLWLYGRWHGLAAAAAFAGLVNFALITTFVWPQWLSRELPPAATPVLAWVLVLGFWIVGLRGAAGIGPSEARCPCRRPTVGRLVSRSPDRIPERTLDRGRDAAGPPDCPPARRCRGPAAARCGVAADQTLCGCPAATSRAQAVSSRWAVVAGGGNGISAGCRVGGRRQIKFRRESRNAAPGHC